MSRRIVPTLVSTQTSASKPPRRIIPTLVSTQTSASRPPAAPAAPAVQQPPKAKAKAKTKAKTKKDSTKCAETQKKVWMFSRDPRGRFQSAGTRCLGPRRKQPQLVPPGVSLVDHMATVQQQRNERLDEMLDRFEREHHERQRQRQLRRQMKKKAK